MIKFVEWLWKKLFLYIFPLSLKKTSVSEGLKSLKLSPTLYDCRISKKKLNTLVTSCLINYSKSLDLRD